MEASHLAEGILFLHSHYWPIVLIPLVIIAVHSILTSHRVAGPLYRFSHVFDAVERGNIPKQINRMLISLRTRIEEIQNLQEEFGAELAAFEHAAGHILPDAQCRQLESLKSKENRLEGKLAEFRV